MLLSQQTPSTYPPPERWVCLQQCRQQERVLPAHRKDQDQRDLVETSVSGAPQTRGSHGGTGKEPSRKGPLSLTKMRENATWATVTMIKPACSASNYANTHTLQPYKFIRWVLKTKHETFTNVRFGPNGPQVSGEQAWLGSREEFQSGGGQPCPWPPSHLSALVWLQSQFPSIETPVSCPSSFRRLVHRASSQFHRCPPISDDSSCFCFNAWWSQQQFPNSIWSIKAGNCLWPTTSWTISPIQEPDEQRLSGIF